MSAKKLCWGLVTRRERLGLSWRGWLLLLVTVTGIFLGWLFQIQPFLTENRRLDTNVMVMEGWIQEFAVRSVAGDFMRGSSQTIYTTGGPVTGSDHEASDFNTFASVGADLLKKHGVPAGSVQMVPCHEVGRDRTYNSALALRHWFQAHGIKISSFNVFTEDAHARRTQLLFQEAFGPDVAVGVVAIPDPDYDPRHWWRTSEGVRMILAENIAYLYARFIFHPAPVPAKP